MISQSVVRRGNVARSSLLTAGTGARTAGRAAWRLPLAVGHGSRADNRRGPENSGMTHTAMPGPGRPRPRPPGIGATALRPRGQSLATVVVHRALAAVVQRESGGAARRAPPAAVQRALAAARAARLRVWGPA